MLLRPIPDGEFLPDGVYLGLPDVRYFQQDALGSTDLSALWSKREGWWWSSRHNPFLPKFPDSKAKLFGSAAHVLLLEGEGVFAERYVVEPDPRTFPDLIRTTDDIMAALDMGGHPLPPARARKPQIIEHAKVFLKDRHIWDDIQDRFAATVGTRKVVSAEDRWILDVMLEAATADEDMRRIVTADGGVRLVEVSVFWTLDDGTRLRFRFDTLLPTLHGDLKTLDNFQDRDLADAIGRRIGFDNLDIQAALSFEARKAMHAAIEAGAVYGGTQGQVDWLARFPAEAPLDLGDQPGWAWCWIFYQKPDSSGRAPVIMPVWMKFGSLRHRDGFRKIAHALAFYRAKVAQFGLEKPWTRVEKMHHLDPAATLQVQIPHYITEPMAVPAEEDHLTWKA